MNEDKSKTGTHKNLLIFGLGYAAGAIGEKIKEQFDTITATNRALIIDGDAAYTHLVFDGMQVGEELAAAIRSATHILVSIAPHSQGDRVINAAVDHLRAAKNLQWIGYLSTVGVYGNHDGEWVDENTSCKPVSARSIERVKAERSWQEFTAEQNLSLAIFRLSGIYGPARNAIINMQQGRSRRLVKKNQVFNRIHRDDIAQGVSLAIALGAEGVFNITDDEPAPPQDIVEFVHQLRGIAPPEEIDFETADISPMARSFYGENKRVSNTKSKSSLGMDYIWPNYKVAFEAMWKNNNWQ